MIAECYRRKDAADAASSQSHWAAAIHGKNRKVLPYLLRKFSLHLIMALSILALELYPAIASATRSAQSPLMWANRF